LNLLFLILTERSTTPNFAPSFLCLYALFPLPFVFFIPGANGDVTDAEDFLDLFVPSSGFAKSDRLKSELLLDFCFKPSCVNFFHAVHYSTAAFKLP